MWRLRFCAVLVVALALGVAMPPNQMQPAGGSEFPLAGLWELLTTRPGWSFGGPVTPIQPNGLAVAGAHEVSGTATRANGGAGRAPQKVKGALGDATTVKPNNAAEYTTPKARKGFDAKTSTRNTKLSSATADVFNNVDGSLTRRVYQEPVNFQAADGSWRPYDNRLSRSNDGRLRPGAHVWEVSYAAGGVAGKGDPDALLAQEAAVDLVSMTFPGGQSLSYGLTGAAIVAPVTSGSTVAYREILPFTDLELTTLDSGVKETIVLTSAKAATEWLFPLNVKGLTLRLEKDGSISLLDKAKKAIAKIPHGWMEDAKLDPRSLESARSNKVRYELVTVAGGQQALKVTADKAWVTDPARVFPIKVDPTFNGINTNHATYVQDDLNDPNDIEVNSDKAELKTGHTEYGGRYNAQSFVRFDDLTWNMQGRRITGGKLWINVFWSGSCPQTLATEISIWDITQDWNGGTAISWATRPGTGGLMGKKSQQPSSGACANSSRNPEVDGWWDIPLDGNGIAVLNRWASGGANYGLSIWSDLNHSDQWKRISSANSGHKPHFDLTYEDNGAPRVLGQYPPHGASSTTLTPELMAEATDPDNWPKATTYQFQVFDPASPTPATAIADSGQSASRSFIVPAGKLQWSKNYLWTVVASDGLGASTTQTMNLLSTAIPQAPITSGLSQNADKGFAPSVGNYTTSAVDAQVATVGPALAISRSYNSRDPRTGSAFGAGWSSLLDSRVTELTDPGASVPRAVIVTYPTGQDVAFGRNGDGTFMPPAGRFSTFRAVTGGYELVDKEGTKYAFTVSKATGVYGLSAVTDGVGRTLTLDYTSGKVTSLTAVSGRKLFVGWDANNRVERVYTEPTVPGDWNTANTWVYSYIGDLLTKVCAPIGCHQYEYGSGSLYPTAVLDAGPHTYLRLNEVRGTTAASSAVDNVDTATGVYNNVSLGQPGPLPSGGGWTGPTAAGFNGTSSYVDFSQSKVAMKASVQSVSMWFKTAANNGVLLSYQSQPLSAGSTASNYVPALYVGTSGKLRGKFWDNSSLNFESPNPVNDNQWHHVVLAATGQGQSLYLDGAHIRTISGAVRTLDQLSTTYQYVGAGFLGGGWPDQSRGDGTNNGYPTYFNGTIAEFAFYDRALNGGQVSLMNAAGQTVSHPLWKVKRPSGGVAATVNYDPVSGVVSKVTDSNNGVWTISPPQLGGSHIVHTSSVLAAAPRDYFRLVDQRNEVNGVTGTFSNVTFGGSNPGPLGETAALFNNSSVVGSGPSIDTSQSYSMSAWVYLTAKTWNHQIAGVDGVRAPSMLFDYRNNTDRWHMNVCASDMDDPTCSGAVSTSVPELSKWTHLAASVDTGSKTIKLYVNGKLEATASFTSTFKATGPLRIGQVKWNGSFGDNWPGRLAEVATYQSVLTEDQVKTQFAARDKASDAGGGVGVPVKAIRVAGPLASALPVGNFDGAVYTASQSPVWTGNASRLRFQNDGNLVMQRLDTNAEVWASGTWGNSSAVLVFQTDGNMVIYKDSSRALALWDSGTWGQTGNVAMLEAYGQLTIKNGTGAQAWGAGPHLNAPRVTTHVYDLLSGGREVREIDVRGGITNYGYDTGGFLRTTSDPNGNLTVNDHDVRGNVIAKTTCQNRAQNKCSTVYTEHYPDATTRVLTPNPLNDAVLRVRDGRSANATDNTYKSEYTYDAQGNVTAVTDPLGRVTRTEYTTGKSIPVDFSGLNATGRYVRIYGTKRGYPAGYSLWEIEVFGPDGRNAAVGRPANSSSNENGNLTPYYAVDGDPTTRWSSQYADPQWIYVDLGSAVTINRIRLNWETAFGENYEIQVSNDASTWTPIKTVTGQSGRAVPPGLKWRTTSPAGAVETVTYLPSGDVAEQIDATGLKTVFTYDPLGRMVARTVKADGGDLVTSIAYDRLSRIKTQTEPGAVNRISGAVHTRVTTMGYDDDGHVTTQTVSDSTGGDAPRTATNTYNALGQLESTKDALNKVRSFTHDLMGNKVTETDPTGATMAYTYDASGQLLTTTLKGWTGDPNNPTAATDLETESRAYDPAGRLGTVKDAMGWLTEYKYTDNGLVSSVTRRDPAPSGPSFLAESATYDAAGNVIAKTTNNGATTTTIDLDAVNRTKSQTVSGVNRTTSYQYSLDDTVTSIKIADGGGQQSIVDTTYDRAGRKIAQSASWGGTAGLSARWKMDGTGEDASGNNSATTSGTVGWSSDHGGSAAFTGAGYLTTADRVIDTTQSFTVAAWVKLNNLTGFQTFVGTGERTFFLQYAPDENRLRFVVYDEESGAANVSGSTAPAVNTWIHVAGVFDATDKSVKFFVNGALAGTGGVRTMPRKTHSAITIGAAGGGDNLVNGYVDDVQLYQNALTQPYISNIQNGTWPGNVAVQRTSWQLDNVGQAKSVRDANGNVTSLENDALGQSTVTTGAAVQTEANGGTPVLATASTATGYNTFGEVVEARDANNKITTMVRDAAGQAVETRLPSYTPPGSSTPINPIAKSVYDDSGQLVESTDPLLRKTSYVYDQLGRLASVKAPNNGITKYTYTLNGEQLSITDPNGARSEATYDYLGRKKTTTAIERSPAAAHVTTYGYDGAGRLASVTPPGRASTTSEYNAVGEPTKVIDGAGVATRYEYDFAGRKLATILADGSKQTVDYNFAGLPWRQQQFNAAGQVVTTTSAVFDANGNMLTATDAMGNTTTLSYNALGAVTQAVQPVAVGKSITTTFGYDIAGKPTRFTDGRGNKFLTTYNAWGLTESEIEPDGAKFTMSYDAAGQAITQNAPGGVTVTSAYNNLGKVIGQSGTGADAATANRVFDYDTAGRLTSVTEGSATTNLSYNDRGQLISATGAAGSSAFAWTPDGQLASRQDAAGTSTYGYDTAGRLSTVADASTGEQAAIGYDGLSRPSTMTYGSSGNKRTFTYDELRRLNSDKLSKPDGSPIASIAYTFDKNSNLLTKDTSGFSGSASNTYGYDKANRLTSWNGTNYAYDDSGNRTAIGSKTYTYDNRNRLTTDGSLTYSYTARGTLSGTTEGTVTTPSTFDAYSQQISQATRTYSYDGLGRVLTASGGVNFTYSGTGNHVASDGTATYSRDPGGELFGVKTGSTGVFAWTDSHNDLIGQFTSTGTILTGSRTFNPLGTVLAASNIVGNLGYQSGWTDPATSQVNMHARWYNPATAQFSSRDTARVSPIPNSAAANRYAYGDGNPLTNTDPTGHWGCGWCSKAANAVKSTISKATSAVSSAYNWVSNKVSEAVDWVSDKVSKAVSWVSEKVSAAVNWVGQKVNQVKTYVTQKATQAKTWVTQQVNNAKQQAQAVYYAVKQKAQEVSNKIQATIKPFVEAAKKLAETHVQALKDAWKATTNWIEEHKAEIAGFVVGAIVGIGCGALIGWTGVGAVACGALAGAVGSLVTGAMKGHTGWQLVGDAVIGGTIGAITGGFGSALSAGIGSGVRGLAGGLGSGARAFGQGARAELSNIGSGLAGGARSLLGRGARGVASAADEVLGDATNIGFNANRMVLMKGTDTFLKNIRNIPTKENFFDVVAHGSPRTIKDEVFGNGRTSVKELAQMLDENPAYSGGPIRLISCSTGAGPQCFAQRLADEMGVEVLGADGKLWAGEFGSLRVGDAWATARKSNIWTPFLPRSK